MTPNLFLATQTLFSPHKWFKPSQRTGKSKRKTEHWDSPVAGIYEYIPGRGWYLVATDKNTPEQSSTDTQPPEKQSAMEPTDATTTRETVKMTQPVQVKYSKVLKRYLLAPDYDMRKRHGKVQDSNGKAYEAGFFRLDDGVAWVECWDEEGEFIPGPYKLWCLDQKTGDFRHMLKGDDPSYARSRANSTDSRRSQDSRTTQYRSGPGSTRDGPSCPSTRANSIRQLPPSAPSSKPGSHSGSRRGSPKRSPSIPLDEAKERLKVMAAEQAARSRANSFGSLRRPSTLPSPKIGA